LLNRRSGPANNRRRHRTLRQPLARQLKRQHNPVRNSHRAFQRNSHQVFQRNSHQVFPANHRQELRANRRPAYQERRPACQLPDPASLRL
jgi:hypothetical protein